MRNRKQWRTVKESATKHSVLLSVVVCVCVITAADAVLSLHNRQQMRRGWRGGCGEVGVSISKEGEKRKCPVK